MVPRTQIYRKLTFILPAAVLLLLVPLDLAQAGLVSQLFDYGRSFFGTLIFKLCLTIGGSILFFGSLTLDVSLKLLVVEMGDFFKDGAQLGQAVSLGWTLIRDVLNMCFIFGLIYIGIKTILNSEDSGTRRALGYLIAAALLINFSLFITQIVVDFSNLLASEIYTQMVAGESPDGTTNASTISPIASSFLASIGISSLLSLDSIDVSKFQGSIALFSLMILIFFSFAGVSFFMGTITIVGRFVALLLYMIFSPVMFLGWILPKFKSTTDKWLQGFFKNAFFAPLYIFLLYMSSHILDGVMKTTTGTGTTQISLAEAVGGPAPSTGSITMIVNFAIMIGLLWASLKVANMLSITGSKVALSGLNRASGAAQGLAYRNTAGRFLFNPAIAKYDALNEKYNGKLGKWGGERARQLAVKSRDYGAGGVGLQATQDASSKRGADSRTRVQADKNVTSVRGGDAKAIGDMTDKQLLDGLKNKKTSAALIDNAHLLKHSQIEAIKKSDLDDETKGNIIGANKKKLLSRAGKEDGAKQIYEQYKKDITKLPPEVLTSEEFAEHIKDTATLSKIANMDGLSLGQKQTIKNNVLAKSTGNVTGINDFFDHNRDGKKFSA